MKKYFVLSALSTICLVQFAIAQVGKGKMTIGGSFRYEKVKIENPLQNNNVSSPDYGFIPKIGFGLSRNWIMGIIGTYDHDYVISKGTNFTNELESHMYKGGVFARKFYPLKEHFGIFGESNLVYGSGNTTQITNGGPTEKWNQALYTVAIYPGFYYTPARSISLEATVGKISYDCIVATPPDGPKKKDTQLNASFLNNLSLGVYFVF